MEIYIRFLVGSSNYNSIYARKKKSKNRKSGETMWRKFRLLSLYAINIAYNMAKSYCSLSRSRSLHWKMIKSADFRVSVFLRGFTSLHLD